MVLPAVAITTNRLNEHPECGAAALIMSTLTEEADYPVQGKGKLFEKALQAMHDPAYQETAAEYKKNGCLWETESVVMVSQILDYLDDAADTQKQERNSRGHRVNVLADRCGHAGQAQLCANFRACSDTAEEKGAGGHCKSSEEARQD